MERIHYAGDSILTGSEIARALLDYAEALAKRDASATVDIPARHLDGTLGRANFLIGPSSQLVAETELSEFPEIIDNDIVANFRHEIRLLNGVEIKPEAATDYSATSVDDLDMPTTEDDWEHGL